MEDRRQYREEKQRLYEARVYKGWRIGDNTEKMRRIYKHRVTKDGWSATIQRDKAALFKSRRDRVEDRRQYRGKRQRFHRIYEGWSIGDNTRRKGRGYTKQGLTHGGLATIQRGRQSLYKQGATECGGSMTIQRGKAEPIQIKG